MKRVVTLEYEDRVLTKEEWDAIFNRLFGGPIHAGHLSDRELEILQQALSDSRALCGHIFATKTDPK